MTNGERDGGRIDDLTLRVKRLESDAERTHALAAMVDRDMGEVRTLMNTHIHSMSALRETQVEQGVQLAQLIRVVSQQGSVLRTIAEVVAGHTLILKRHGEELLALRADVTTLQGDVCSIRTDVTTMRGQLTGLVSGQQRQDVILTQILDALRA